MSLLQSPTFGFRVWTAALIFSAMLILGPAAAAEAPEREVTLRVMPADTQLVLFLRLQDAARDPLLAPLQKSLLPAFDDLERLGVPVSSADQIILGCAINTAQLLVRTERGIGPRHVAHFENGFGVFSCPQGYSEFAHRVAQKGQWTAYLSQTLWTYEDSTVLFINERCFVIGGREAVQDIVEGIAAPSRSLLKSEWGTGFLKLIKATNAQAPFRIICLAPRQAGTGSARPPDAEMLEVQQVREVLDKLSVAEGTAVSVWSDQGSGNLAAAAFMRSWVLAQSTGRALEVVQQFWNHLAAAAEAAPGPSQPSPHIPKMTVSVDGKLVSVVLGNMPFQPTPTPTKVALTISANAGGTVSYQASAASGTVPAGGSVTVDLAQADNLSLTANPASGNSFSAWTPSSGITGSNAAPVSTISSSIVIAVNSNSQIAATFAQGQPPRSPVITSISPILPQQKQVITITGTGFGSQNPFNGTSLYLRIHDNTGNWDAGWSSGGLASDWVTVSVSQWTDTQIVLQGFGGRYGGVGGGSLNLGDNVTISIWNAITKVGPGRSSVTIGSPNAFAKFLASMNGKPLPNFTGLSDVNLAGSIWNEAVAVATAVTDPDAIQNMSPQMRFWWYNMLVPLRQSLFTLMMGPNPTAQQVIAAFESIGGLEEAPKEGIQVYVPNPSTGQAIKGAAQALENPDNSDQGSIFGAIITLGEEVKALADGYAKGYVVGAGVGIITYEQFLIQQMSVSAQH